MIRAILAPAPASSASFGLVLKLALSVILALAIHSAPTPAAAAEAPRTALDDAALDAAFAALAAAGSETEARAIEARIWTHWMTAPDERSQFLMEVAVERNQWGDRAGAVYALDELIDGYPDYAEAWNQRATTFFFQRNYEQSLDDIAEVLAREPRHFGALAGKFLVLRELGRPDEAQRALVEALRINPWLRERRYLDPDQRERKL